MSKPLNKYIDHTLLKPTADRRHIRNLCLEAKQHNFASVCVNPIWVSSARGFLTDSDVAVSTVVGFPLGANGVETKVFEAVQAVNNGADELDMVINVAAMKRGLRPVVFDEIITVYQRVRQTTSRKIILKVILECCYLTDEEKAAATSLCIDAGADFVKTSTGFGSGGATVEDVIVLKEAGGDRIQIKASGGISKFSQAQALIEAGATRIGTSSGVAIVAEDWHEFWG